MASLPAHALLMKDSDLMPVVLVTGAGAPRVGNCIARTMAAAGYRVAVHALNSFAGAQRTAAELTDAGHPAIAVQADLREERQVQAMVEQVAKRFGRIDALVNSAGIWEAKLLEEVTADDVRRHFDSNTLSTFLCCQHVGRLMVGQDSGGAIVNLGDWAVVRPYCEYAAYFPSKGAIPTLTRNFAVELARRNPRVRVNAVLPGPVMLPDDMPQDERRQAIAGTLVKREGTPNNVADAVRFLIENDFITGVCLPVDGGRTVHSDQQ